MKEHCRVCCLLEIPRRKFPEMITRFQTLNQNV